jgi:hypothetical protein
MTAKEELKNTDSQIAKGETDLASTVKATAHHQKQQADAEQEITKYRADASNGNEAALKKYNAAKITADLHRDRVRDLKVERAGQEDRLNQLRTTRGRLLVKIDLEALIGDAGELLAIAREFREGLAGPIAKSAALKKGLKVIFTNALPYLGERHRLMALERSVNQSVDNAVRSEMQKSFGAVGIDVVDNTRYGDSGFDIVMTKAIDDLTAALEVVMHTASPESVEGRKNFRVVTQVHALHGRNFSPGEIISLNGSDPQVLRLIAAGGLEEVSGDKAVPA